MDDILEPPSALVLEELVLEIMNQIVWRGKTNDQLL